MRIFLKSLIVAVVAFAAAFWIHNGLKAEIHRIDAAVTAERAHVGTRTAQRQRVLSIVRTIWKTQHRKAPWQDPVAVLIAGAGVGAGAAIVAPALRKR
jgi:hypothetical protein